MTPKSKKITNIPASVRARLLNVAKAENRDYNALLRQYFQERFLYRLSISDYKQNFILKGAFLFLTFDIPRTRPTKDIDFLGRKTSNDPENIRKIVANILEIETEDGVQFLPDSVKVESITMGKEYHGLRVRFTATMGTIKRPMQVDLGFGDIVVPPPNMIDFPTILDMPAPNILAYQQENIIAEKFEAIVKLHTSNSRMKDFYDIYYLAANASFKSRILADAVKSTFHSRGTDIEDKDIIFSAGFRTDTVRLQQWNAFLRRNSLETELSFDRIIGVLDIFLNPLFENEKMNMVWSFEKMEWVKAE